MGIEVRPARPDEYAALGEITVAAYRGLPGGAGWLEHLDRAYAPHLADVAGRADAAVVLAAVEDGELLGCATYVPGADSPEAEFDDPAAAGIRMLAVAPGAQGRGAGRALVAACIVRARRAGKARVVLHTQRFMDVAAGLYISFGFVRRPDLDWSPAPAVDLEGYVLELAPAQQTAAGSQQASSARRGESPRTV